MRSATNLIIVIIVMGMGTLWIGSHAAPHTERGDNNLIPSSVMFIENVGQFREGAHFQSQSEIGTMFVAKDGALWFTVLEPVDRSEWDRASAQGAEPPLRGGVNLRLFLSEQIQILRLSHLCR